jgi:hypothetical protein
VFHGKNSCCRLLLRRRWRTHVVTVALACGLRSLRSFR